MQQPEFAKETEQLQLGQIELANDYRHLHADAFFVGLADLRKGNPSVIVSVVENQIVPAPGPQGTIGARFVRRGIATLVADVEAARDLHAALGAALADLSNLEQSAQQQTAGKE